VDWSGCGSVGPLRLFSAGSPALPWFTAESIRACPRLGALLGGRVELSSVTLEHVRVRPGPRFAALREVAARAARASRASARGAAPAPGVAAGSLPSVSLQDVTLELELGRVSFPFGPFDVKAALQAREDGRELSASAHLPGGARAKLGAFLFRDGGGATLSLLLEHLRAELLPPELWDRLPVRPSAGAVSLEVRGNARERGRQGELQLSVRSRDLQLSGERLAPGPVGPFAFSSRARLHWDADARRASLAEGRLCLGTGTDVCLQLAAEVSGRGERPVRLAMRAQELPFAATVAALPEALRPAPSRCAARSPAPRSGSSPPRWT